jgi:hypothetical protein
VGKFPRALRADSLPAPPQPDRETAPGVRYSPMIFTRTLFRRRPSNSP